jgi:hypothetical protein
MSEVYRYPGNTLPIHRVLVFPLIYQRETEPLKDEAQIAGGVSLKEPAVGIAFLLVCICTVRGNRNQ